MGNLNSMVSFKTLALTAELNRTSSIIRGPTLPLMLTYMTFIRSAVPSRHPHILKYMCLLCNAVIPVYLSSLIFKWNNPADVIRVIFSDLTKLQSHRRHYTNVLQNLNPSWLPWLTSSQFYSNLAINVFYQYSKMMCFGVYGAPVFPDKPSHCMLVLGQWLLCIFPTHINSQPMFPFQ